MKKLYLKLTLLLVFIFTALCVQAQTGSISGQVLDEANLPLPGATVSAGGKATVTNVEGKYAISGLPAGGVTVSVKFVGYQVLQQTVTMLAVIPNSMPA
jgi:hypothetical protein